MVWIIVLGLGWIIGLAGVTAAVTSGLLEGAATLRRRPRWVLLWLVLTPACGAHCGARRELPPGDGCELRQPAETPGGTPGRGAECAGFTSQTAKTPT